MGNKLLKLSCIPVYLAYAYLFGWQIYFLNQQSFWEKITREAYTAQARYMPAVILLLYALLLYVNMLFKQKRMLAVNSIIAATVIGMYSTPQALILTGALVVFALVIAAWEIKDVLSTDQR